MEPRTKRLAGSRETSVPSSVRIRAPGTDCDAVGCGGGGLAAYGGGDCLW